MYVLHKNTQSFIAPDLYRMAFKCRRDAEYIIFSQ